MKHSIHGDTECYSNAIILAICLAVGVIAFIGWLKEPHVYIDSNGECVKVIPKPAGDCYNLPDTYIEVHVK